MIEGGGVFAKLGVEVFDDYWMNYRTRGMAQNEGFSAPPYTNLKSYQAFKRQGADILDIPEAEIETGAEDARDIEP
ncbi:MAG: EcoRV family type II restriction endonuclease [Anaerolineae bacterium]|nr:EcoRV family type II restriction endonuclease [Anaerolineae bacterium]